jgi:hypothetical protein
MSTTNFSQKQAEFVSTLIKLGHIDRQDSQNKKDSTMVEIVDDEMPDKFIETISDLGIVDKDLLFLGSILRYEWSID